jgi:hypothetical protein
MLNDRRGDREPRGIIGKGGGLLFKAPGDPALIQIVWRHLHFNAVANREANPAFSHLAADGGEHFVLILQRDAKHRSGQHLGYHTFDFDMFFFHT